ncbi:extracellular solute-binding protein [Natrialba swarupiae]|nr:extracellular solute-binding protein [Natrialba swarupiae]
MPGGHYLNSFEERVFEEFESEYGITVEIELHGDQFAGYSQIQSGQSDADMFKSSPATHQMGAVEGVWHAFDADALDNYGNLLETFQNPIYDPEDHLYGIPYVYGTVGMAYNRDELGELDSWEACWDTANDGDISMQGTDFLRVFTTAMYLGMDPNDIEVDGSYEAGSNRSGTRFANSESSSRPTGRPVTSTSACTHRTKRSSARPGVAESTVQSRTATTISAT